MRIDGAVGTESSGDGKLDSIVFHALISGCREKLADIDSFDSKGGSGCKENNDKIYHDNYKIVNNIYKKYVAAAIKEEKAICSSFCLEKHAAE